MFFKIIAIHIRIVIFVGNFQLIPQIMGDNNGKYIFGVVKVGDKGQIVIPKDARKKYDIKPGDALRTFNSDIPGRFESDMGDTFKVLQSLQFCANTIQLPEKSLEALCIQELTHNYVLNHGSDFH